MLFSTFAGFIRVGEEKIREGGERESCFLFLVRYLERLKMRKERRCVLPPVLV